MSHLSCGFLRRTIQKDGNPWRRLLRIKEGKPQVSNASATNAVYHSIRGNLLRPANWHLGPRRAGRAAIVLPILPCRHKENHTSVPNFDVVAAERPRSAAGAAPVSLGSRKRYLRPRSAAADGSALQHIFRGSTRDSSGPASPGSGRAGRAERDGLTRAPSCSRARNTATSPPARRPSSRP